MTKAAAPRYSPCRKRSGRAPCGGRLYSRPAGRSPNPQAVSADAGDDPLAVRGQRIATTADPARVAPKPNMHLPAQRCRRSLAAIRHAHGKTRRLEPPAFGPRARGTASPMNQPSPRRSWPAAPGTEIPHRRRPRCHNGPRLSHPAMSCSRCPPRCDQLHAGPAILPNDPAQSRGNRSHGIPRPRPDSLILPDPNAPAFRRRTQG